MTVKQIRELLDMYPDDLEIETTSIRDLPEVATGIGLRAERQAPDWARLRRGRKQAYTVLTMRLPW